jgi:hypothetical protein
MSRVIDLRSDYDRLGELLAGAEGSAAAAIARERRIIGELLDQLESPVEVPLVDQLAKRRRTKGEAARPPARRRQSG